MLHAYSHHTTIVAWRPLLASVVLMGIAFSASATAQTVTSLTLTPSTIAGGSGGTSTATVTLSGAAPAGGTVVTLGTSNPALAASVQRVTVPAGATSASFAVATNAMYRRYSGLVFTATISAQTGGTTVSATLTVTAQPLPADINSDSTQRFGTVCGGHMPASSGDHGVLYECRVGPDFGTVGKCSFRQECLLGCQTRPADGFKFQDVCAASGPYPIQVSPTWIEGGKAATATLRFASPAPERTNARAVSDSQAATVFPQGFRPVPAGTTSFDFRVATSIVPSVRFVELDANFEIPNPIGNGSIHLADRPGLAWLAVAPPPENPPSSIQPVLGFFEVNIDPVTGGTNSSATIWLSGVSANGGPTINLTSSDPAVASIAPSVTIPPGSNVANEAITTRAVANTTTVTFTATEGPRSLSDTLTVTAASCTPTSCSAQGASCGTISNGCGGTLTCGSCTAPQTCGGGGVANVCGGGTPAPSDTVSIQRVEYETRDQELRVEATSTSSTATLEVFVTATNQRIGTLTNNGGGRYSRTFTWPTNPQNITVRSSLGGSASSSVTLK